MKPAKKARQTRQLRAQIRSLQNDVSRYCETINKYRTALTEISDFAQINGGCDAEAVDIARVALGLPVETRLHTHTCQQCGKVMVEECECVEGPNVNMWCSGNCRDAFDL